MPELIRVPVIGEISAGSPSEWIPIEKWRWSRPVYDCEPGEQLYGMIVVGSSLTGKRIFDGDVLIYIAGREPQPGDLCVIQTPWGITAKFVHMDGHDTLVLKAANKDIPDRIWPRSEVKVLGVVKRVERDL